MSAQLRTPLKTATGLGSAKEGVGHFIAQRVTAVALMALVPWFVWSLVSSYAQGFDGATAWLAQPVNAVAMILLISAAFFHMRIGMQVVIEDYIGRHGTRLILVTLNTFLAAILWVAGVFSILKVALAG